MCIRDRLHTLSGGQRRRVELARILFADSAGEPTTLLLDEPTNHLSLTLAEELEDALGTHAGAVVLASHDRWLRRRWHGDVLHLQPGTTADRPGRRRDES